MFGRKSIRAACMPFLLSCLTFLAGGTLCFFCWSAQKGLPSTAAFYTDLENQLMENDLPAAVCAYASRISAAQKNARAEAVKVEEIFTAGDWSQVLEPQMAQGQFYELHEIEEEKAWVVVSEELATQMFFTTDVVGRTLLLGEKEYTVTGVIQRQGGALAPFCGQGIPALYRQATNESPINAQGIFVKGWGEIGEAAFRASFAELMQQQLPEGYFESYAVTGRLLKTCEKAACILLALCALWWAEGLCKAYFKSRASRFLNGFTFVAKGIKWGFCLWGARAVVLSVPASLLPAERLFDMGHYLGIAAKAKQSEALYNITFPLHHAAALSVQAALFLLGIVVLLFILTWVSIKMAEKTRDP